MPPADDERSVSCRLAFALNDDAVIALQVATATTAGEVLDEQLEVVMNGREAAPVREVATRNGGRVHVLRAGAGTLEVWYRTSIRAPPVAADPGSAGIDAAAVLAFDDEAIVALRQSRYCPSDALAGFASVELAGIDHGPAMAREIASWVFERLSYELGASGPLDTAVDTLLANAGVCRDFAHVTIALCRAMGVPARLASVYAPGLSPMDFHAVVEARQRDGWEVLDPTRLAPRGSLVRIATGRDAADTAFATTLRGDAELLSVDVMAIVGGDLPADDHRVPMALA